MCRSKNTNAHGTERGTKLFCMNFDNKKIKTITLAMLRAEGKKIAFIDGNRIPKDKNILNKRKSLSEHGQLVPAIIMDASVVNGAGLELVDALTSKPISKDELENYVVILDGQHRFIAWCKNEEEGVKNKGDFFLMYPLNSDPTPQEVLSEANIATDMWSGGDYGRGALLMNVGEDLPLLVAINELTALGSPLSTACKWFTFKDGGITKELLAKAMTGNIDKKLKNTANLERGKRLLEAAKKAFSIAFLFKRYLIDFLVEKYESADDSDKARTMDQLVDFLSGLERSKVEALEKAKGIKGDTTKEQVILDLLNQYYNDFLQK